MKKHLLLLLCSLFFGCLTANAQLSSGSIAPNFIATDIDGNTHDLYSYLDQGKTVVIDVMATWCPPCIAEMPSIQNLYTDYKDKVEFLLVTNDPYSEINEFLDENNYDFKILRPVTFNTSVFDVSTIPRTFLIDKTGKIIIDETGAANWNSDKVRLVIDNLLKE